MNVVDNQFGSRIKDVRTDNGKEFVNANFMSLLNKHGIIHQRSSPYTPPAEWNSGEKAQAFTTGCKVPHAIICLAKRILAILPSYNYIHCQHIAYTSAWLEDPL